MFGILNLSMTEYTDKITEAYIGTTTDTGENKPHNNIQPYIVTYIWRRISQKKMKIKLQKT